MRSKEYKCRLMDFVAESISSKEIEVFHNPPFVLLLGPSAIGKSTVINELNNQTEGKFGYVRPYTTRPQREGEVDKISVSEAEFQEMENGGKFVYVKELYGNLYGTPLAGLQSHVEMGRIPILDFPLSDLNKLDIEGFHLYPIYIFPQNLTAWYKQLNSVGRNSGKRLRVGFKELREFVSLRRQNPRNSELIKFGVVNQPGEYVATAQKILDHMQEVGML